MGVPWFVECHIPGGALGTDGGKAFVGVCLSQNGHTQRLIDEIDNRSMRSINNDEIDAKSRWRG